MASRQDCSRLSIERQLIADSEVRKLAEAILARAPAEFWERPSSRSGRHHPPDERGPGGVVLHTRRCARVALHLSRAFALEPVDRDILIAAMLVHDIAVSTGSDSTGNEYGRHPLRVREMTCDLSSSTHYDAIMRIVEAHMGRWGPEEHWRKPSLLQKLGHLADFIASRDDITVHVQKPAGQKPSDVPSSHTSDP